MAEQPKLTTSFPPAGYPQLHSDPSGTDSYPPPSSLQPESADNSPTDGGENSSTHSWRTILIVIIVVVVVACIFVFVTVLFWPANPGVSLAAVAVPVFNFSGIQLEANWDVTFTLCNPNRFKPIYYRWISASVWYGSDRLAQKGLDSFYQLVGRSSSSC